MRVTVQLTVNGEYRVLAAPASVADLVAELAGSHRGVAVAVNGDVVPRSAWAAARARGRRRGRGADGGARWIALWMTTTS